jgi:transcriptional regulator, XRE family
MTNKEKFLTLVSKEETKTVERAKARASRRFTTKYSKKIALSILIRLDELKWKQSLLAEKMGVSPQQVSKWIKGNENFTLETLGRLSEVLGVEFIQVSNIKEPKRTTEIELKSSTLPYEDSFVSYSGEYRDEAVSA